MAVSQSGFECDINPYGMMSESGTADLHHIAGGLTRDLLAGGLIFYDYGMMSEIGTARRGSLLELFYGVYRRDADAVIAALINLGIIVPTADAISLRRAITFSLDNLLRKVG